MVDVDDCTAAATWLAEQGLVDADRLAIRGGSAGGYTTLATLCFKDVFAAGTSFYGLGDLEVFTDITHKFESRYMDYLVGALPGGGRAVPSSARPTSTPIASRVRCW